MATTYKKIYFLHHDAAGFLHDRAYASPPSAKELERIRLELATIHGESNPRLADHPRHAEHKYEVHVLAASLVFEDGAKLDDGTEPPSLAGQPVHTGAPVAKAAPMTATYRGEAQVIQPGDPNHPLPEFRGPKT